MHGDRNLLDVITAVARDLRHNGEFRALLRPLNEAEARRAAARFVEFLYRVLDDEPCKP
jgi:hypothetical protein